MEKWFLPHETESTLGSRQEETGQKPRWEENISFQWQGSGSITPPPPHNIALARMPSVAPIADSQVLMCGRRRRAHADLAWTPSPTKSPRVTMKSPVKFVVANVELTASVQQG